MLGIGIAVPVLPLLVGDFTTSPNDQATWYGILASVFGLMQFLCMPALGALSDKIGRRPVLIYSSAGMSLNFLLTAWAPTLGWMFLGRVVGGACSASMSTATAYASDISTQATRTKMFGMVGAAFGLGFVAGPMIGGLLGEINHRLPFYVGAALCAANAVFGYFHVKESLPHDRRNVFTWPKANPFASLFRLFARRDIGALILVFGLASLAQYLMHGTWVLFTHFKFGWGPWENGVALFFVGITAAVTQAVLLSRMLKRFGEVKLSLLGLWTGTVVYVGYGLSTQGWMFYALILSNLFAFASGPAMQAIASKATDPKEQGALMGSLQSLGSLAIIAGTLLGTQIFAAVSHLPKDDWRLGAPFFTSALLLGFAWWIARGFFARHGMPVHPANAAPVAAGSDATDKAPAGATDKAPAGA
ncbi:MAG: MFS transporter [Betaproteobacteria bacterium]|nr:MFS transporter [Betaproteobacteria bacterium]